MIELSTLERVEIKEVWPLEAGNFTPWLAKNLDLLAEALGMDLEFEAIGAAVGDFILDILARDPASGQPVVIENQLGRTDHDHLGKLLTYAAGAHADVVVWIAREFRQEHRAAIDWLNQRTDVDTAFFAVAIEAWRIDGSKPAPRFNLVAAPNNWEKQVAGGVKYTERQIRYGEFFQDLVDTMRVKHGMGRAQKGNRFSWQVFPSGHAGLRYSAYFSYRRRVAVELSIDRGDKETTEGIFKDLFDRREQLQGALGDGLVWDPVEGKRVCRVGVWREGSIDDDEGALADIRAWMVEQLLAFRKGFGPHLDEIAPKWTVS